MSSYRKWTKHPVTDKWEVAYWLDDALGPHIYGVKFEGDDKVYNPADLILQTDEKRELPEWEGANEVEVEKGVEESAEEPIKIGRDDDTIETVATLYPGQTMLELPKDMESLIYLKVDGTWLTEIRGHWLVFSPASDKSLDVTLHYKKKDEV